MRTLRTLPESSLLVIMVMMKVAPKGRTYVCNAMLQGNAAERDELRCGRMM